MTSHMFAFGLAFARSHTGDSPIWSSTMSRSVLLVLVLVISFAFSPGIVAAADDPRFEAHAGQAVVDPGGPANLSVTILNDAEDADDRVEPATNVKATMKSGDTPFTVTSGTRYLGTVKDGQPVVANFALTVPQDVAAGTYDVPIEITYEYDGDERETTTVHATVRVEDRAVFEVVDSTESLAVGTDGTVELTVENVGTAPARDGTLEVRSKSPAIRFDGAESANHYVGSWEPGEQHTVTYSVTATKSAEPRPYSLVATVAYDDTDQKRRHSAPMTANVVPDPEQTFDVEALDSTLQVGADGRVTYEVTNTGGSAVSGVTLELVASGPQLQSSQVKFPVGDLGANESANASVPVNVSPKAEPGTHEFTTRVHYDDADGDRLRGDTHTDVIDVAPEQSFDVEVETNTLRVNREGELSVSVTNAGPATVENANLRMTKTGPTVHPETNEYAIGSLEPGESTTANFSVEVADGAAPSPRQFTFELNYDDRDGDRQRATPQILTVDVAPEEPIFDLEVVDAEIPAGESGTVTVEVTNTDDRTLYSINAKAFTDASLSVTDDSAFVAELEPGESTTVEFGVSVPGDALAKDYPLSMDFQYREPDGETELSDTYDIPVAVTESEGPLDAVLGLYANVYPYRNVLAGGAAGLGAAGLGLGLVGLRRRRRDDE